MIYIVIRSINFVNKFFNKKLPNKTLVLFGSFFVTIIEIMLDK